MTDPDTIEPNTGHPDADVEPAQSRPAPQRPRPRRNRRRGMALAAPVVREVRSPTTLLLVLACVLIGIPATIALAPDQKITIAGQYVSVGARTPDLSLSGPAQLVQVGNTRLDIAPLQVYGPLRPRLTLGPVQRDAAVAALGRGNGNEVKADAVATIGNGFLRWYGWATLVLLGFAAAACAVVGCVRMLWTLRGLGRASGEPVTVAELWQQSARQLYGMTVVAVAGTLLVWATAGWLAYDGAARGLQRVHSLVDLVGTYHVTPSPVGPKVHGYAGAVIGDSRAARLGGPALPDASAEDTACGRSVDSLAANIGSLTGDKVLNLACSGASISGGLRGPQAIGDQTVPPQIGRLKQVEDLRFVVVAVGPNDLYWADFLRYCYGVQECQDNLSQGEFSYRLAAFDRDYGDLLQDLNDLPGHPQIVIVTSYDVFQPDANCADARGPQQAVGLSPTDLELLADMNEQLNTVLAAGAEKYSFAVATPRLSPLCTPGLAGWGPDLQGLDAPYPFHPTAIGEVRIAAAVATALAAKPGG